MEPEQMNEQYREKRFPQGSVLIRSNEKTRKSSKVLLVLVALLELLLAAGEVYFLSLIRYHKEAGHAEQVTIGWVFFGVLALFFLLLLWAMTKLVKNAKAGPEATIAACAKHNGLSEEEVREFDRQALRSDSYILKCAGAVSAAMANQTDGLLTRDYLWLGDAANSILKRSELAGACLYQWTYYAGRKRLHATSLAVVDHRGRMISAEADTQRGKALLAFLAGQCPGLRVEERLLREGKEFDQWKKDLTADPA